MRTAVQFIALVMREASDEQVDEAFTALLFEELDRHSPEHVLELMTTVKDALRRIHEELKAEEQDEQTVH